MIELLENEEATIATFVKQLGNYKNKRLYWHIILTTKGEADVELDVGGDSIVKSLEVEDEELLTTKGRSYLVGLLPLVIVAIHKLDFNVIRHYKMKIYGRKYK
jgi:hypothetical protein